MRADVWISDVQNTNCPVPALAPVGGQFDTDETEPIRFCPAGPRPPTVGENGHNCVRLLISRADYETTSPYVRTKCRMCVSAVSRSSALYWVQTFTTLREVTMMFGLIISVHSTVPRIRNLSESEITSIGRIKFHKINTVDHIISSVFFFRL